MIYVICSHPALTGSEIIQVYVDTPENLGKFGIEALLQGGAGLQIQVREVLVVGTAL